MKNAQFRLLAAGVTASLMSVALLANQAAAELIGNSLISRGQTTDGSTEVYEVYYHSPMPSAGTLNSVSIYQAVTGDTFSVEVLQPTGGSNYQVTYDSGPITTSGLTGLVTSYALPDTLLTGAPTVAAGDFFVTYGNGIPFDQNQTQSPADVTYYPISTIPSLGSNINLSTFSSYTGDAVRIYSAAVNLSPVPEPGSFVLFGLGALGLIYAARRRRKA